MGITLGHLDISDKAKQYVNDCLDNNRLSKGKYTIEFENRFSELHECKHGIFMNSGTSALQVALAALKERYKYEEGAEVLVPAITFIATSNIVLQNGLKPVFVDVDPYTFNINPQEIEKHITYKTRAIIPVHLFGLPADMPAIVRIARDNHLDVIEDSCETMFAGIDGKSVGSFGDLACFSTYVAHLIVGGVGGLVITDDDSLAEMCRSLMAHGRDSIYTSIDDDDTITKDLIERRYKFDRVGYSYRATEIEAAIALSELERWQENISRRRYNASILDNKLSIFSDYLQRQAIPLGYDHSYMMYPLVCKEGVDREDLLMYLEHRGIETRYLFPLLSQPVYQRLFPGLAEKYPVASRLEKNGFFVGMHQGFRDKEIEYIADTFGSYFGDKK